MTDRERCECCGAPAAFAYCNGARLAYACRDCRNTSLTTGDTVNGWDDMTADDFVPLPPAKAEGGES